MGMSSQVQSSAEKRRPKLGAGFGEPGGDRNKEKTYRITTLTGNRQAQSNVMDK